MIETPRTGTPTDDDTLDVFSALINVWLALDAIKTTIPEPQAQRVSLAVDGLADVMARLMKRHKIEVSTIGNHQEDS